MGVYGLYRRQTDVHKLRDGSRMPTVQCSRRVLGEQMIEVVP